MLSNIFMDIKHLFREVHILREEVKQIMMTLADVTTAVEAVAADVATVDTAVTNVLAKLTVPEAGIPDAQPQVDAINAVGVSLKAIADKLNAAVPPVVGP